MNDFERSFIDAGEDAAILRGVLFDYNGGVNEEGRTPSLGDAVVCLLMSLSTRHQDNLDLGK